MFVQPTYYNKCFNILTLNFIISSSLSLIFFIIVGVYARDMGLCVMYGGEKCLLRNIYVDPIEGNNCFSSEEIELSLAISAIERREIFNFNASCESSKEITEGHEY